MVQEEKDRILNEALKLIEGGGLEALSMRKLASKCGITATTIYNYFLNKDELYLTILVIGFSRLADGIKSQISQHSDPYEKLKAGFKEYIRFGIEDSCYYNIMFTFDYPKYTNYFGKREEAIALEERRVALIVVELFREIANEIMALNKNVKIDNMNHFITEIWCMLHGYISLYNSKVMQTIEEDVEAVKEKLIARIMNIFML